MYQNNAGEFSARIERKPRLDMPPLTPLERQTSSGSRLGLATTKDTVLINKAMIQRAQVVFLGDSIVAGIPPRLQRHHFQNFGVSGSCVEDVLTLVKHTPLNNPLSQISTGVRLRLEAGTFPKVWVGVCSACQSVGALYWDQQSMEGPSGCGGAQDDGKHQDVVHQLCRGAARGVRCAPTR